MQILRIIGAVTDDQRQAIHKAVAIWSTGGICSKALLERLPDGPIEIHVVSTTGGEKGAIIVIAHGILGFHRLDESVEATIH
jgi:hypothetical protein